jgi:hypothetical protein
MALAGQGTGRFGNHSPKVGVNAPATPRYPLRLPLYAGTIREPRLQGFRLHGQPTGPVRYAGCVHTEHTRCYLTLKLKAIRLLLQFLPGNTRATAP